MNSPECWSSCEYLKYSRGIVCISGKYYYSINYYSFSKSEFEIKLCI